MPRSAQNAYLESRILSADPLELVCLLYQGAISEIREARRHLQAKDVRARVQCINRAYDILVELTVTLDRKAGGAYAENLAKLYDYMMTRITEANFKQADEPLAEVLGLLSTLKEGWDGIKEQSKGNQPAASARNAWAPAASQDAPQPSQSWSF